MNYEWADAYMLQKLGVQKDYKAEWDAERYRLLDKMFAMRGTHKDGRPLLSIKLDPQFSEMLRTQFPDEVIPGYYLNKTHWSSVYLDGKGELPEQTMRAMLDNAHSLIMNALPKRARMELLGGETK